MPRQQFIFTKPVGGKGGFLPFTTAARLGSHHSMCPLWDTEGVIPTLRLFIFIPGVPSAASSTIGLGAWSPVPLMVMVEQPPIAKHIPELWVWFLDLWNSCIGKVVMSFLQETSPVFCMSFFFYRQKQGPILQAGFVCLGQMCGYFWWLVWHPPSTMLPKVKPESFRQESPSLSAILPWLIPGQEDKECISVWWRLFFLARVQKGWNKKAQTPLIWSFLMRDLDLQSSFGECFMWITSSDFQKKKCKVKK